MHNNNNNKRRPNNMNGGGNGTGGQHRHHNNNRPRRFNNNRPQNEGGGDAASVMRTRRNATQSKEKYQMMAHEATRSGDRVLAEYYLQHADHYHRVLLALPPEEVRAPYTPRHTNADNAQDAGQGEGAGNGQENGHGGNGGAQAETQSHGNDSHHEPHAPSAHALPSFITSPVHVDGPEE